MVYAIDNEQPWTLSQVQSEPEFTGDFVQQKRSKPPVVEQRQCLEFIIQGQRAIIDELEQCNWNRVNYRQKISRRLI
jgi:hypothetical protein